MPLDPIKSFVSRTFGTRRPTTPHVCTTDALEMHFAHWQIKELPIFFQIPLKCHLPKIIGNTLGEGLPVIVKLCAQ